MVEVAVDVVVLTGTKILLFTFTFENRVNKKACAKRGDNTTTAARKKEIIIIATDGDELTTCSLTISIMELKATLLATVESVLEHTYTLIN